MRSSTRLVLALTSALTVAADAHAHVGARPIEGTLSELPPSPVKRRLLDLRERARGAGVDVDVVEEPIRAAIRALERARQARLADDDRHARTLDQVGAEWARVAERLLEARLSEHAALEAERRATELSAKQVRARTLLEENQARLGRLEARRSALMDEQATIEREQAVKAEKAEAPRPSRRPTAKAPRGAGRSKAVTP
jgi:hypothetical protein